MIRINLLPFRAARKRENIRRQLSVSGLLFLLFLLLLGVWFIQISSRLSELKDTESSKKTELAGYQKELAEIKKLEKDIKEINTKLDVIKDLEKGKTGPVRLLSTIADAVPKDQLWLTSLSEGNGKLTLKGTAMDNETVALFMNNLEAVKEVITSVSLKGVTQKELKDYNLKVADFTLECRTYEYKAETKKTDTKKK